MRPLKRQGTSKRHDARKFNRNVGHTKAMNVKGNPMRGGIRL